MPFTDPEKKAKFVETVPVSAWDLSRPDHWRACWYWSNSQPLLAAENLTKAGANRLDVDYTREIQERLNALK
jgi:acyl-ACP thioesterase